MSGKKILLVAVISLFIVIAILVVYSIFSVMPHNPVETSKQLVMVVSRTETAQKAVLHAFDRDGDTWRFNFSCPVVIGKNGMAWGRGLHNDRVIVEGEQVKVEGDGKTPKGAFELIRAYGYQMPKMVRIKFPYTQITPDMICIDDARSEYYNMIVRTDEKKFDAENLPSHEDMLRDDDLYKYAVLIGHNTENPEKSVGSCIFLHIWSDEDSFTAGCTAMSEESMLQLLAWLDPDKKPCLVQLTRKSYRRLKEEWGLPDVTI